MKRKTEKSTFSPKIAIFVPSFGRGGAERNCAILSSELARQGMKVDLVIGNASCMQYSENLCDDVRVIDFRARRTILALPALAKYLYTARPDALLSTRNSANITAFVAKCITRSNTNFVIRIHNTPSIQMKHCGWRGKLLWRASFFAARHANGLVAVSRGCGDDFARACRVERGLITTIYNPVLQCIIGELSKRPAVHPWFEKQDVPLVLGVGSLTAQKDFKSFLRAIHHLRRRMQVRAVILGDGVERVTLQRLIIQLGIEDDVALLGQVDNPYAFMSRSTVFLLSSVYEGCPNAMLEAIACGCPVVATDCPSGPREILGDCFFGRLVKVGDIAEMSSALESVIRQRASFRLRESGLQRYSLAYCSRQWKQILLRNLHGFGQTTGFE